MDLQPVHHQFTLRMVIQEQQITGTKGMQNWKIYALTGAPELFYEWLGVEFAIKREEYSDRMRHHHWGIRHHPGSGLLTHFLLLFRR